MRERVIVVTAFTTRQGLRLAAVGWDAHGTPVVARRLRVGAGPHAWARGKGLPLGLRVAARYAMGGGTDGHGPFTAWHVTAIDLAPRGRQAKREALGATEIEALEALARRLEARGASILQGDQ